MSRFEVDGLPVQVGGRRVALVLTMMSGLGAGCVPDGMSVGAVPPGTLRINEYMAAPHSGRAEWIEIKNVGALPVDVSGCVLSDGGITEHHDLLGAAVVEPGGLLLLSEAETVAPGAPVGEADLPLWSVAMVNTGWEELRLTCPDGAGGWVVQDETGWGSGLRDARVGRSWQRAGPDRWCGPEVGDAYYTDPAGREDRGTPGMPNSCGPDAQAPRPGQVLFTELMVAPATGSTDEWMELWNGGDEAVELSGCLLALESGGDVRVHRFDEGDGRTWIPAGEHMLLGRSGDRLLPDGLLRADHAYGSMGLPNAAPFRAVLSCPADDEEIPGELREAPGWYRVHGQNLDWRELGAERGFSMQADPVSGIWCAAAAEDLLYDDGWGEVAFGTPGAPNRSCGGGGP